MKILLKTHKLAVFTTINREQARTAVSNHLKNMNLQTQQQPQQWKLTK